MNERQDDIALRQAFDDYVVTRFESRALDALVPRAELWIALLGGVAVWVTVLAHIAAWSTVASLAGKYQATWLRVVSPGTPNQSDWIVAVLMVSVFIATLSLVTRFTRPAAVIAVGVLVNVVGAALSWPNFRWETLLWGVGLGVLGHLVGRILGRYWRRDSLLDIVRRALRQGASEEHRDDAIKQLNEAKTKLSSSRPQLDLVLLGSFLFCSVMSTSVLAEKNIGRAPIYVEGHPELLYVLRADSSGLIGLDVANQLIWIREPERLEGPHTAR